VCHRGPWPGKLGFPKTVPLGNRKDNGPKVPDAGYDGHTPVATLCAGIEFFVPARRGEPMHYLLFYEVAEDCRAAGGVSHRTPGKGGWQASQRGELV